MNDPQPNVDEAPPPAVDTRRLSRRKFLRRSALVAAGGAFLYAWRVEPHWVEVVRRAMPIERLPDALVGARLVQISDMHAGPIVDQRFLLESAEMVADLRPDIIVLTGDFVTFRRKSNSLPKALEFVARLPKPRLGTVAILGNHDYGFFWKSPKIAQQVTESLAELEVPTLRNAVIDVGGLQFAGIDDLYTRHFNPALTLSQLDPAKATVVLVHNPDAVDQPGWGNYRGWVLSGHTHGGQCKPPLLPPPFLPVENRTYVAGEYDGGAGKRLYVNRGLGYLERVRFNCRPEITVFTLERA